ncbi:glycosyltransferase [Bernardetia litoralis DSM 6794]|uniref:Glycosyltransferase n=1 Tax=Bernardetia litoralis (strain ATCC 23117 / DSM 6794 / NBRC 15988 / NCIMB 1366 / Fx l1 / Sio-4) TaxID=880071 RepID=I4ALD1_BERLS|nr:glycosyltransferase [Bernardetia litoralis]AFM04766.1 glycosyltransferase [Bernardetia litoralis DSM 6794]
MKIAYLSTFFPFRGGIAQFNALLYRNFEKLNISVSAYNFTTQYPEFLFPGQTQYSTSEDNADQIPTQRIISSINPVSYLSTASKISKEEPNLLLMRYWLPFFAPALGTVAKKLKKKGTKSIVIVDNMIPHEKRFFDEIFTKYFLKNTDAYIVMSKSVEKDLLERKPNAKYIFHPHPIYEHFGQKIEKREALQKLGLSEIEGIENKKILLYFGFVRKYKGLDLLLEAFKNLDDSYFLIIAGESYLSDSENKEFQSSLDNHPKKQNIDTRLRYVSDNEVNLLFSAADANVLPYRHATQSGVSAIAFHFEVPSVVTDVGGLRDLIEPYNAGTIAESATPKAIQSAIEELFDKKNEINYGENLRIFKEKYSWENLAKKILELYEEIE